MKKVLPIEEQEKRAILISPFFHFIINEDWFKKDVESLRVTYGISKHKPPIYIIPLHLLYQEYWNPDFDSMQRVNSYWSDLKWLWQEFHKEIEKIAEKYYLRNFPDLLKEYILTWRFRDSLIAYKMIFSNDRCDISIRPWIKKREFNNIWKEIQEYNKNTLSERPWYYKYSEEVIKKYEAIQTIWKKYAWVWALLLVKKQLFNNLSVNEKDTIKGWDKSKKSRLNHIARNLSSLVRDLNEEEK